MRTLDDGLGFLVADVQRQMRRLFQQRVEDGALSLAQSRALVYIARHQGLRQVELAELLDLQPITVGRLVDQLAESGLVERRVDPSDRRAFLVHLLPAAHPHLDKIHAVIDSLRKTALAGFDAREAGALTQSLLRLRANLAAVADGRTARAEATAGGRITAGDEVAR
ncbi:MAG: MarR family transcriptional regulator [Burkholderiaceae bacterium]